MTALPDHLRAATARRTEHAAEQAQKALARMLKNRQPISFTAVAREAGVSTDFLYRHQQLRPRIERHRAKSGIGYQRQPGEEPTGSSSAVRALTRRLEDERRDHRNHTAELRKALEAVHGENLELRRRLARYEPD
ncbi:DUF6262 family protein [Nocardia carnea]|uniref:DUF6262 family protein n=1 Tax=Nocardia carnea TaxID=37328 RepID=A0ABW7TY52_9NOCA|nr:DUF6262 family protein [Nocardia carnea]